MKNLITVLLLQTAIVSSIQAQITTKTLPAGIRTNTVTTNGTIAGNWTGTQTNDYGQYPQAFNFQLTTAGEFLITNQNGSVAVRGTYSFSNNIINGSYKLSSSGETISFTGNYDPTTQKLNCTMGSGTNTTGQGKLVATKTGGTQIQTIKTPALKTSTPSTVAPPPPTSSGTQPSGSTGINNLDFYLTNVIVRVHTGNDNKEALSKAQAHLYNPTSTQYSNVPGPELLFSTVGGSINNDYKNEFVSNTVNVITLYTPYSTGFDGRPRYRDDCINLVVLLNNGVQLDLYYLPNFLTDAWKIEKVEVQFEFKNSKGELHPVYSKTIIYPSVSTLLTNSNNKLTLRTDKFLMPVY